MTVFQVVLTSDIQLTLVLLSEQLRGEASPFYGWLQSTSPPDIPLLWTAKERALFYGTGIELELNVN
jgi:hypothetical protein